MFFLKGGNESKHPLTVNLTSRFENHYNCLEEDFKRFILKISFTTSPITGNPGIFRTSYQQ